MKTWWIIWSDGKLITTVYSRFKSAVGPYWSVGEALDMIEKWR